MNRSSPWLVLLLAGCGAAAPAFGPADEADWRIIRRAWSRIP